MKIKIRVGGETKKNSWPDNATRKENAKTVHDAIRLVSSLH